MRIAILQRDPVRSKQLERILVQAGHSCMVYDDGLTMAKALARSTGDLLVLDWSDQAYFDHHGRTLVARIIEYVRENRREFLVS